MWAQNPIPVAEYCPLIPPVSFGTLPVHSSHSLLLSCLVMHVLVESTQKFSWAVFAAVLPPTTR